MNGNLLVWEVLMPNGSYQCYKNIVSMTIVTRPNITNITKYHQPPHKTPVLKTRPSGICFSGGDIWQYLVILDNTTRSSLAFVVDSRSLSGIIISVANYQSVLHIFSLTVVSLCILLNP